MKNIIVGLVLIMSFALSIGLSLAGDEDIIPPEILKQMDKDILQGNRPIISKIRQGEIFNLRNNPLIDADFVTFQFEPGNLSSVQKEIIKNWIHSGVNKLFIKGRNISKYRYFFSPMKVGSRVTSNIELLRHPVNTDCNSVKFVSHRDKRNNEYGNCFLDLPMDASSIVETNKGEVVCGNFQIGKGKVYFINPPHDTDARRWILNWWHWALGLRVPGSSETAILAGAVVPLADKGKYDFIELKNGDRISGDILNKSFTIKTAYANLTFDILKVIEVSFDEGYKKTDIISLSTGDRLSGSIQDSAVKVKLTVGREIEIEIGRVKNIQMKKNSM